MTRQEEEEQYLKSYRDPIGCWRFFIGLCYFATPPIIKEGKKILVDSNYIANGTIIKTVEGKRYIKRSLGKWDTYTKDYWDDENHLTCDNFPNCDTEGCGNGENVGHRH